MADGCIMCMSDSKNGNAKHSADCAAGDLAAQSAAVQSCTILYNGSRTLAYSAMMGQAETASLLYKSNWYLSMCICDGAGRDSIIVEQGKLVP